MLRNLSPAPDSSAGSQSLQNARRYQSVPRSPGHHRRQDRSPPTPAHWRSGSLSTLRAEASQYAGRWEALHCSSAGPLLQVERIHEVECRVCGAHFVVDVDQEHVARTRTDFNSSHVDARLQAQQRLVYFAIDAPDRRGAQVLEYQIVDTAA